MVRLSATHHAIGLSVAAILFANGLTLFMVNAPLGRDLIYMPASVSLLAMVVGWARHDARLTWEDIGLTRRGWLTSMVVGGFVGLVMVVPSLIFFAFPFAITDHVHYAEIERLDFAGFLWRVGAEAIIATAFTEEFIFRGVLQSLYKRSLGATRAIVATNVVFMLWHLVPNVLTLQQNPVVLPFVSNVVAQSIGYLGSLIAVAFSGFVFSVLRERTKHLAGSIVAHWVAVAMMTIAIYLMNNP